MSAATVWDVEESGKLCPTGNHAATIGGVLYVGKHLQITKKKNEKGEEVEERYLSPTIVLLLEIAKLDENGDPYVAALKMAKSMGDRAGLKSIATNLAGYKPGVKFDPRMLINVPCMAQVVHGTSAKGKKYWKVPVGSIAALPEGMKIPTRVHKEDILWSVTDGTPIPTQPWIPWIFGETLKTLVEQSVEWKDQLDEIKF